MEAKSLKLGTFGIIRFGGRSEWVHECHRSTWSWGDCMRFGGNSQENVFVINISFHQWSLDPCEAETFGQGRQSIRWLGWDSEGKVVATGLYISMFGIIKYVNPYLDWRFETRIWNISGTGYCDSWGYRSCPPWVPFIFSPILNLTSIFRSG